METTTNKEADTKTLFLASLTRKAAACGLVLTGLTMEAADFDRTWGDRVGYVFAGLSLENCARIAEYFSRWYSKNGPKGSYNAQRSVAVQGLCTYLAYDNGAQGWHKGDLQGSERTSTKLMERRQGWGCSTTYYPCAD